VTRRSEALAILALVGITAVWGATFVLVKDAIARMPVMAFLAWRFGIATLAMVALRPRSVAGLGRRGRRAVFTPLIGGLLLHQRVGLPAWVAVAVATCGLALISLRGVSVGRGEALTLLCAVCFALHIVGLGEWSSRHDAFPLAVVQLGSVTALCAVLALPLGGLAPPPDAGVWGAVGLTAILATALAFVGQTWAQAHLPPARTAVVLTLEPVFAGVFGVLLGGDRLGVATVVGAALVIAAMLIIELSPRPDAARPVERLEV